jgi:outer membrane protein OmpA-like peptidoglycan-associated protein
MKTIGKKYTLVSLLAVSTLITGCQSVNPYTGQTQVSNTAIGTGVGTVGGAAIGALVDGGRGALIGGALGAAAGGGIGYSMDAQNEELRRMLMGTGVQVTKFGNSIQLVMSSDITFDNNQSDLRSSFYPTLNSVAIVLKKYNKTSITITGYTDSVGNDSYNQVLSEKRAASVGNYLIAQGISTNRINTNGMGKRNPVASNDTSGGRALNRRVVITLRPIS